MNVSKCCRCDKRVYPTEELKCLDRVWHKGCFKCYECGMILNLKTYKGYDKKPYCNAHVPQVKYTAVADTPEARRLAENTRIQSNIKYHQDFEKLKGKVTQVADDPETLRICSTSKIISNVAYHGELEKKKQMEEKRSLLPDSNGFSVDPTTGNQSPKLNKIMRSDLPLTNMSAPSVNRSPTERNQNQRQPHNASPSINPEFRMYQEPVQMPDKSPYSNKMKSTVIYTSGHGPVNDAQVRKVGSIADYDPINDNYGSIATNFRKDNQGTYYYNNHPSPNHRFRATFRCFRAMYDYQAQDRDEVSFREGDVIVNCQPIDEGWMNGTVQRTGAIGMLPANYVEPIN